MDENGIFGLVDYMRSNRLLRQVANLFIATRVKDSRFFRKLLDYPDHTSDQSTEATDVGKQDSKDVGTNLETVQPSQEVDNSDEKTEKHHSDANPECNYNVHVGSLLRFLTALCYLQVTFDQALAT